MRVLRMWKCIPNYLNWFIMKLMSVMSEKKIFFLQPIDTLITVWSAAPQISLWGGPWLIFEPGTGDLEAGTLTTRPPHLLTGEYCAGLVRDAVDSCSTLIFCYFTTFSLSYIICISYVCRGVWAGLSSSWQADPNNTGNISITFPFNKIQKCLHRFCLANFWILTRAIFA